MGWLDFVKSGVKEMMIARPNDNADLIYKHPDNTIPMFSQVTVHQDEWVVFAKEGRAAGTLDAGRHTLQAASIPFLQGMIDGATGGNFLMSELFFVKRTPFPMRFGGSLGHMLDQLTGIRVRGRCHGELQLQVTNPEQLIWGYFGNRRFQDHPEIFNWLTEEFFSTVKTTIGKVLKEQNRTLLDIVDITDELRTAFVQRCQGLNDVGIRVSRVVKFEVDIPEEDLKRFDEMNQQLAQQKVGMKVDEMNIQRAALQAQAEAAKAQVGVTTAGFNAQANQYALDQKLKQDQQYAQMAGGWQQYAAGSAMIGAGQGMAQGGGDSSMAAMTAQMGVGMAMGNAMGGAMPQFMGVVPGRGAVPAGQPAVVVPGGGAMPPPPPPIGVVAVFHVQFQDGVVQLQGPEQVRAEIARRGIDPAIVMLWTNGMPSWAPAAAVLAAAPPPPPPPR